MPTLIPLPNGNWKVATPIRSRSRGQQKHQQLKYKDWYTPKYEVNKSYKNKKLTIRKTARVIIKNIYVPEQLIGKKLQLTLKIKDEPEQTTNQQKFKIQTEFLILQQKITTQKGWLELDKKTRNNILKQITKTKKELLK